MKEYIEEARTFIQSERNGTLCTLSRRLAGFPFGSIAPYALTASGEPILLISDLAEHTKNIRADARVSFLIQDSQARDQQANARATMMGYAMPVSSPFVEEARQRYLQAVPTAAGYFSMHDFSLFKVHVLQVRFIGGFGNIFWINGEELIDRSADARLDPLAAAAESACEHMNKDHQEALIAYAKAFAQTEADTVKMLSVDSNGLDLVAITTEAHQYIRLDFPSPVHTTDELRKMTIELAKQAHHILAGG